MPGVSGRKPRVTREGRPPLGALGAVLPPIRRWSAALSAPSGRTFSVPRQSPSGKSQESRRLWCSRDDALQVTLSGQWPALHPNREGARVIDLFSGCGGLSVGFAALGALNGSFHLAGAADISEQASATYALNLGLEPQVCNLGEISEDDGAIDALLTQFPHRPGVPTVIVGGPPCQGFSSHSKRNKNGNDGRNGLVVAFAKIAARADADVVVMENVPEVLSGKHWNHFERFREILGEYGYVMTAEIHSLASYGLPQERFRATVIAAKERAPQMPRPVLGKDQYRTVRDAIGNLPPLVPGEPDPQDPEHVCAGHRKSTIEVIRQVPIDGGNRPKGVGPACLEKVDGFRDVYGRLAWSKPANTITGSARNPASGRFVHPEQHRGLSVREAALLQGFPPDFRFTGSFDDRFSQVGNAVPPLYALHVAAAVSDTLAGCECSALASVNKDTIASNFLSIEQPTRNSFSSGLISLKAKSTSR